MLQRQAATGNIVVLYPHACYLQIEFWRTDERILLSDYILLLTCSLVAWRVDPSAAANRRIRRIFVRRHKSAEKNSASAVILRILIKL